jgi:hypothetical protein
MVVLLSLVRSSKNFDHERCSVEILPAAGLEPGPCDQGVKLRLNTKFDSRLEFGGLFSRLTDFAFFFKMCLSSSIKIPVCNGMSYSPLQRREGAGEECGMLWVRGGAGAEVVGAPGLGGGASALLRLFF